MFPEEGSPEEVLMRAYILLTILHDNVLEGRGTVRIAAGIWDPRESFVWKTWQHMTHNWEFWRDEIDHALEIVKADLPYVVSAYSSQGKEQATSGTTRGAVKQKAIRVVVDRSRRNVSKCVKLLQAVANDAKGQGVECRPRAFRSLCGWLKNAGYPKLISHLTFDKRADLLKTTLPAGALIVDVREKP